MVAAMKPSMNGPGPVSTPITNNTNRPSPMAINRAMTASAILIPLTCAAGLTTIVGAYGFDWFIELIIERKLSGVHHQSSKLHR